VGLDRFVGLLLLVLAVFGFMYGYDVLMMVVGVMRRSFEKGLLKKMNRV